MVSCIQNGRFGVVNNRISGNGDHALVGSIFTVSTFASRDVGNGNTASSSCIQNYTQFLTGRSIVRYRNGDNQWRTLTCFQGNFTDFLFTCICQTVAVAVNVDFNAAGIQIIRHRSIVSSRNRISVRTVTGVSEGVLDINNLTSSSGFGGIGTYFSRINLLDGNNSFIGLSAVSITIDILIGNCRQVFDLRASSRCGDNRGNVDQHSSRKQSGSTGCCQFIDMQFFHFL